MWLGGAYSILRELGWEGSRGSIEWLGMGRCRVSWGNGLGDLQSREGGGEGLRIQWMSEQVSEAV